MITPEKYMWMAGYGSRDRPADGKLTDLWAKALVLQDGSGQRAVLVTLDVIGVSRDLAGALAETLKQRYGLERRQLALCASHTHSGPVLYRNLSPLHELVVDPQQRQLIEEYTPALQNKILQVIGAAMSDIKPAQLSWASGTATFAVNRRNNPEAQVPQLRAEGKLRGPFDHDVPVLAVRDSAGKLRAVVFGYACHATVLSGFQWCGDYPGLRADRVGAIPAGLPSHVLGRLRGRSEPAAAADGRTGEGVRPPACRRGQRRVGQAHAADDRQAERPTSARSTFRSRHCRRGSRSNRMPSRRTVTRRPAPRCC